MVIINFNFSSEQTWSERNEDESTEMETGGMARPNKR